MLALHLPIATAHPPQKKIVLKKSNIYIVSVGKIEIKKKCYHTLCGRKIDL